jgi:hypothetical protein
LYRGWLNPRPAGGLASDPLFSTESEISGRKLMNSDKIISHGIDEINRPKAAKLPVRALFQPTPMGHTRRDDYLTQSFD